MASVDAPQPPTAAAAAAPPHKTSRAQSPPSQSKRERKKQLLWDKLAVLNEQMSRDRDRTYREELQKIQADLHLVSRVDPYSERPLDDIEREVRELSQANTNGTDRPNRTLLEMAGPSFQEWLENIKDLLETRDYELTSQKVCFLPRVPLCLTPLAGKLTDPCCRTNTIVEPPTIATPMHTRSRLPDANTEPCRVHSRIDS
jgi:hypothetical protein